VEVPLKIYFACLFGAKPLMTASKVIFSATFLSTDRIAKFVSLVWFTVDLRYVLINVSVEKLLSQLTTLTHIVKICKKVLLLLVDPYSLQPWSGPA